jgi:hypothetical protein
LQLEKIQQMTSPTDEYSLYHIVILFGVPLHDDLTELMIGISGRSVNGLTLTLAMISSFISTSETSPMSTAMIAASAQKVLGT